MKTKKNKLTVKEFKAQYKELQKQLKEIKIKLKAIHKEAKVFSDKCFKLKIAADNFFINVDGRIIPAFSALPKIINDLDDNVSLKKDIANIVDYL